MPPYEDKLITETEAAKYLGIATGTLQQWRSREQGPPYVKLNKKSIRYSLNELARYIKENSIHPAKAVNS